MHVHVARLSFSSCGLGTPSAIGVLSICDKLLSFSLASVRHDFTGHREQGRRVHWQCKLAHMNLILLLTADITLGGGEHTNLTAVPAVYSNVVVFLFS